MPGRKASEETRREQIILAAHEVAARQGLNALTVRLVAAEAKLSTGLVFFHFTSRDQLLVALLDRLLATTTILRIGPGPKRPPSTTSRRWAARPSTPFQKPFAG